MCSVQEFSSFCKHINHHACSEFVLNGKREYDDFDILLECCEGKTLTILKHLVDNFNYHIPNVKPLISSGCESRCSAYEGDRMCIETIYDLVVYLFNFKKYIREYVLNHLELTRDEIVELISLQDTRIVKYVFNNHPYIHKDDAIVNRVPKIMFVGYEDMGFCEKTLEIFFKNNVITESNVKYIFNEYLKLQFKPGMNYRYFCRTVQIFVKNAIRLNLIRTNKLCYDITKFAILERCDEIFKYFDRELFQRFSFFNSKKFLHLCYRRDCTYPIERMILLKCNVYEMYKILHDQFHTKKKNIYREYKGYYILRLHFLRARSLKWTRENYLDKIMFMSRSVIKMICMLRSMTDDLDCVFDML